MNISIKLDEARGVVQRGVNEELRPSMVRYLTLRRFSQPEQLKKQIKNQKKLEKLAGRQDRPLGRKIERSMTTIDDKELPH